MTARPDRGSFPRDPSTIPSAGAIVFDAEHRLLMIRRGRPPAQGFWSVPGGKSEPGEVAEDTCVREVAEETGLAVEVVRFAGRVERPSPDGRTFAIDDFVCQVQQRCDWGLRAASDASEARWVTRSELARLPLVDGLWAALVRWDVLPD